MVSWSAGCLTRQRTDSHTQQSHLRCHKHKAVFQGTLDTKTLGGAGFASQRTVDDLQLDLSKYDGMRLVLDAAGSDQRKYTFILKDSILPRNPDNGREQSTISWEFDFEVPKASPTQTLRTAVEVFIPWQRFRATYRGKEKKGVQGPKLSEIKRLSIMMRRYCTRCHREMWSADMMHSFFDTQHGDFQLTLLEIGASSAERAPMTDPAPVDASLTSFVSLEKTPVEEQVTQKSSMWHWLLGRCGRL